jgi:hypothetical protein
MRTARTGRVRPITAGAALACAGWLAAGCGSSSSPAGARSPAAPSRSPAAAASPGASPSASASPTAASTFLAPGQDLNAKPLHRPACDAGCLLSGDGTASLYKMTWTAWSAAEAVGTGTYKLDDCSPDCAQGTVYPVTAVVTLSGPVRACSSSGVRWFWSRASFRFPDGLPNALRGPAAPENPWTFSALVTAAQQSCS